MEYPLPVTDRLTALVTLHEGVRQFPYRDSVGKLTIGVGFNLDDVGLLPDEIEYILESRLGSVAIELGKTFPWFDQLNEVRQAVLIDMAYNLGVKGLLKFRKALSAITVGDFSKAADEMLDSTWATQVGKRAQRLSRMMETGKWPDHFTSS